ncbi:uncharacterized protein LOC143459730 [Clavelina lepadiformis]|uniref:uncharacterized protein LOC143459730 n=1 Tax=Clavelina lepadiformis TaxID=159417 RepID=UPI00404248CD
MGATIDQLQSLVKSVSNTSTVNTNRVIVNRTSITMTQIAAENQPSSNENTQNNDPVRINNEKKRAQSKRKWKQQNQLKINASERKRKGRLAANIAKLKEIVPTNPLHMQTQETVLEEALKYIKKMEQKISDVLKNGASNSILLEMDMLKEKVKKLEEERKLYRAVLQSHGIPPVLNKNLPWKTKLPIPRKCPQRRNKSVAQTSTNPHYRKTGSNLVTTTNTTVSLTHVSNVASLNASSTIPCLVLSSPADNHIGSSNNDSACSTMNKRTITNTKDSKSSSNANSLAWTSGNSKSVWPLSEEILSTSLSTETCIAKDTLQTVSLSKPNPLLPPIHSAVCKPTWSQARMQVTAVEEIPKLQSITVESVRQNASLESATNLNTTITSAPTLGTSSSTAHNKLSACAASSTAFVLTSHNPTTKVNGNSVVSEHNLDNISPSVVLPSTLPLQANSFHTTGVLCSLQGVDAMQAATHSSVATLSKSTVHPQSLEMATKKSTASVSESPLLSWIRSYETPAVCVSGNIRRPMQTLITPSHTPVCETCSLTTPVKYSILNQNTFVSSKKQACNSFNIASLMKSADSVSQANNLTVSASTNISSGQKVASPVHQGSCEIHSTTPKDMFPQSFENDFLDCLHILPMPSLTTPEPPSRHPSGKLDMFNRNESNPCISNSTSVVASISEKRKDANISIDLTDLFHNESSDQVPTGSVFFDKSQHADRLWSVNDSNKNLRNSMFHEASNKTIFTANQPADKERNINTNRPLPVACTLSTVSSAIYATNNSLPSLWQPGITNSTQSRTSFQELPSDSFTPHQHFNSGTSRLAPNGTAQPLNHISANPGWMQHHAQTNRFPAPTRKVPSNSIAITSANVKSRNDSERKRKAAKPTQQSKRKKSAMKTASSGIRKEPMVFPQIVGYQYSTPVYTQSTSALHHAKNLQSSTPIHHPVRSRGKIICNERGNALAPTTKPMLGHATHVAYGPDYGGQNTLFHSSPAVGHQTHHHYPSAHSGYHFPYNHPMAQGQQSSRQMYMPPHFANSNNNNNNNTAVGPKQHKGSQYNIQHILS